MQLHGHAMACICISYVYIYIYVRVCVYISILYPRYLCVCIYSLESLDSSHFPIWPRDSMARSSGEGSQMLSPFSLVVRLSPRNRQSG